MKHIGCLILVCCLIFSGCSAGGDRIKEPVTFYYVSEDYQKDMTQVVASETREASGHRNDLSYLLALYSMGPAKEGLKSLLPRNTNIRIENHTEENLELYLSESALTIPDADFALASACISLTCMELADVHQVTVNCGERSLTIQSDQLLMNHHIEQKVQEDTE